MNLPSDLQRLLPYIVVAVLAVAGLLLVVRGLGDTGGSAGGAPDTVRTVPIDETPGQDESGGSDNARDHGSNNGGGGGGSSDRGRERTPAKRSSKAYISCVQQAMDTAALERCQAFLPRR
jgi:hypothetical protein